MGRAAGGAQRTGAIASPRARVHYLLGHTDANGEGRAVPSCCHPRHWDLSGDGDLESPGREDQDGNGSRLWAALTTHRASVDRGPCPGSRSVRTNMCLVWCCSTSNM